MCLFVEAIVSIDVFCDNLKYGGHAVIMIVF